MINDAGGIPLAASVTGGSRNDITQLLPLIEAIPRVAGLRGRPCSRPTVVYADRAYDHDKYRRLLRAKGISTRIARRGHPHGSGLAVGQAGTGASGDRSIRRHTHVAGSCASHPAAPTPILTTAQTLTAARHPHRSCRRVSHG